MGDFSEVADNGRRGCSLVARICRSEEGRFRHIEASIAAMAE